MMKTTTLLSGLLCLALFPASVQGQSLSPKEIIRTADERFNGEKSSISVMAMTIVRPTWERTVEMKNWTSGRDHALTLITAPARDKGQSFLKRENEMWNWNPTIGRLIKLPPSMMSQGWMGSDYTNDDILKESSVVEDYTHELLGEETIEGRVCKKIRMTAKEDADVIWGSQIRWVDTQDFMFLKSELYDEDGYLIRTELGKNVKTMDGRLIPTRIELIPAEAEGHMTVLEIREVTFNETIPDSFFSQQNMKRVR
ncbi:MAG: outer membrane lipoprotein-sorting protein [Bacteroidales bacterium]